MKWELVVSSLLPCVAAALSPYKRFVSHHLLQSQRRVKTHARQPRNPERTGLPGLLAQTHPVMTSSVVISMFPLIGQTNPPEKLGSQSPCTVPQNRLGRVSYFPTQVRLLLSFSREIFSIHPLVPQVVLVIRVSILSSIMVQT